MQGTKHVNRMIKVKVARAPQYDNDSPTPTQTTAAKASSASHSAVSTALPTSTAALAGVIAFLTLALLLVLGTCFYRRRQRHARESKAPSAVVDFNRDAFTEKKSAYSPSFDQHVRANITNQILESKSQTYQSSISSSSELHYPEEKTTLAWKPQVANTQFRVTNDAEGSSNLTAVPKRVSEKKRPTRSKPAWVHSLNINPEDVARSPPPSYDIASGGTEFLFPVPAKLPAEKSKAAPTPPTPPANRKSHGSPKRPFQNLIIPTEKVAPQPIPSPARSASFAPKELNLPTPPVSAFSKASSPPSSKNPFSPGARVSADGKAPKLMNVIAPYTPTLADELRVQVGDTVRVLQEYQDGWCFAQFVGKGDTPKGVVPMVCLEDRRRVVPVAHKTSNGSMSSLNNWR